MATFFASFFASSSSKKKVAKERIRAEDDPLDEEEEEELPATQPLASCTTLPYETPHVHHPAQQQQQPIESNRSQRDTNTTVTDNVQMESIQRQPTQQRRSHAEHVQFRNSNSFISADEAAILAVASPEMNLKRIRSISKLFTALPTKLPSYQQMVVDQLEFLCHVVLLETIPERVVLCRNVLEEAIQTFARTSGGVEALKSPGRLRSRLLLASFAIDLFLVQENENGVAGHVAPIKMRSNDWNVLTEKLIEIKKVLSQQSANLPFEQTQTQKDDQKLSLPDAQAAHPMMTIDYQHVLVLLKVQRALASFRECLESVADDKNQANKVVKQIVNGYIKNLLRIFPLNNEADESDDELDDDDYIFEDNDDDTGSNHRSFSANIPKVLSDFVLTDLYRPKQKPKEKIVESLLDHVRSITEDSCTPTGTDAGPFSYHTLLQTIRALLQKWAESILEIPILVQLGYAGVISPIVEKNGDDVSSFGAEDAVKCHYQLKQSRFKGNPRESSNVSCTDEDHETLVQLAAAESLTPRSSIAKSTQLVGVATQATEVFGKEAPAVVVGPSTDKKVSQDFSDVDSYASEIFEQQQEKEMFSLENLRPSVHNDCNDTVYLFQGTKQSSTKKRNRQMRDCGNSNKASKGKDDKNECDSAPHYTSAVETDGIRQSNLHRHPSDALKENNHSGWTSKLETSTKGEELEWTDDEDIPVHKQTRKRFTAPRVKYPFTEEEEAAIREGVKKFGVGKWKEIRDFDPRLSKRDNKQIKDKYRNMMHKRYL